MKYWKKSTTSTKNHIPAVKKTQSEQAHLRKLHPIYESDSTKVQTESYEEITAEITEELWKIIKDSPQNKSPDGFNTEFYQVMWPYL